MSMPPLTTPEGVFNYLLFGILAAAVFFWTLMAVGIF